MEDNEEEKDHDNYPTFPEHGGTTIGKTSMKKSPLLISPMMIFVGSLMMHI